MKKRKVIFASLAVVAISVAGVLWLSQKTSASYSGLAARFPDSVLAFAEVRQLGQWMETSATPTNGAAQPVSRGQDPLLGILGKVWAAEGGVQPGDLPLWLKDQALAIGVWKNEQGWRGASLLASAPQFQKPIEDFLKEKLGEGNSVGTVSGITFREAAGCEDSHIKGLIWGVGADWTVICTGLEEAKLVLTPPASPLDTDPLFLETASRFPTERGAWVFVRGEVMNELAMLAAKGHHCDKAEAAGGEDEEKAPAVEGKPEEDKALEPPGLQMVLPDMKSALSSVLPKGSFSSIAVWTAPPSTDQGNWEVEAWVGKGEGAGGFLSIFTGGGSKKVEIADSVPKDASTYCWFGGEDPANFYKRTLEETAKVLPPDKMSTVRAAIGASEGKLGLSFANDLLPCFGDEGCVIVKEGEIDPGCKEGEGDGCGGCCEGKSTIATIIALRDPRRLQSLMKEKVAPALSLVETNHQGATGWKWSKSGDEKSSFEIIIRGQELVLTTSPDWALGSGTPGKAWTDLNGAEEKYSLLVVADPAGWGLVGKPMMVISGKRESDGLTVKASFPGKMPKWNLFGKGDDGGEGDGPVGVTGPVSGAPAPSPKVSGSL